MLNNLIRELRGNESLRDAGKRIGISHTYLDTLEKGIDKRSGSPVNPTPDTLKLIAEGYNYSYEKLLFEAGYISSSHTSNTDSTTLSLLKTHPDLTVLLANASEDKLKAIITLLKD